MTGTLSLLANAIVIASIATSVAAYKFMAIADWGTSFEGDGGTDCSGSITIQQKLDADAMGKYAAENAIEFVLLLGDNFYGSGIHGTCTNCRFQATFENIYNASSLNVPFYAISGNHDHLGNVTAQIEYSKISKRWNYPDWFYTFTKSFNGVTVQFLMFDTVLADAKDGKHGPMSDAPGTAVPDGAPTSDEQYKWLEETLQSSTADFIWVGGHYPVWSGCEHGPTASLVEKLKPMLEKYHVTGYVCGHDHCEEYIDEGAGPVYVLTGSGFECCYKSSKVKDVPSGAIKFAYWDGECPSGAYCPPKSPNTAFTVFDVDVASFGGSPRMTVTYIDSAGKVLFTSPSLKPRYNETTI